MTDRAPASPLLSVENLTIEFPTDRGWQTVVEDISFAIASSQTVGIVGESGSGKTVTALAILGLTAMQRGRIVSGQVQLEDTDLLKLSPKAMRKVRGRRIGMIFQEPIRSLNPVFSVGEQIAETLRSHEGLKRPVAWQRAVELLDRVHIPNAARRAHDYPHMFSGGMCQRAVIAMALACSPSLLIADEPTTALDVSVQMTILELLREMRTEMGISILFVSHDLSVIAEMCDRVLVMYAGQIAENATIETVFYHPAHPYTEALLASLPQRGRRTLATIPGSIPEPGQYGSGCHFVPRCSYAVRGRCDTAVPPLSATQNAYSEHVSRCFFSRELHLKGILSP